MNSIKVGDPMPTTLGLCADEYHEVRDLRLAMQHEVEMVEAREKEIKAHLIANLSESDSAAAGQFYRAQRVKKLVIAAKDWVTIHRWVKNMNRFDMLQKRLNETAVKEWMEKNDNRDLPGTESGFAIDISVTKI